MRHGSVVIHLPGLGRFDRLRIGNRLVRSRGVAGICIAGSLSGGGDRRAFQVVLRFRFGGDGVQLLPQGVALVSLQRISPGDLCHEKELLAWMPGLGDSLVQVRAGLIVMTLQHCDFSRARECAGKAWRRRR